MRVVIAGGTGQVGTVLARSFHARGEEVTVLGRHPVLVPWRFQIWDGRTLGEWTRWISGADVVINLAGRSVNCRYNAANRKEIMDSRVNSARAIGAAIAAAQDPPPLWLQASTATIYAHRYDAPNDERAAFSAAWRRMRPRPGASVSKWREPGRPPATKPSCRRSEKSKCVPP